MHAAREKKRERGTGRGGLFSEVWKKIESDQNRRCCASPPPASPLSQDSARHSSVPSFSMATHVRSSLVPPCRTGSTLKLTLPIFNLPPRSNPRLQLLFECATGLAIFTSEFAEEIGKNVKTAQDSIDDVAKFGKLVKLVSFVPFQDAAHALEVANDVSEG